jgi:hypothetical protein
MLKHPSHTVLRCFHQTLGNTNAKRILMHTNTDLHAPATSRPPRRAHLVRRDHVASTALHGQLPRAV